MALLGLYWFGIQVQKTSVRTSKCIERWLETFMKFLPGRHVSIQSQQGKHQNSVWNLLKANNEDTRTTSTKKFHLLFCYFYSSTSTCKCQLGDVLQGGIKNFWINFSTVRGTSFSEPHCQLYFDQWPVNWNIIGNVNFFLIVRFIIWFLLCLWIWHLYVGVDIKRVSTEMNL